MKTEIDTAPAWLAHQSCRLRPERQRIRSFHDVERESFSSIYIQTKEGKKKKRRRRKKRKNDIKNEIHKWRVNESKKGESMVWRTSCCWRCAQFVYICTDRWRGGRTVLHMQKQRVGIIFWDIISWCTQTIPTSLARLDHWSGCAIPVVLRSSESSLRRAPVRLWWKKRESGMTTSTLETLCFFEEEKKSMFMRRLHLRKPLRPMHLLCNQQQHQ